MWLVLAIALSGFSWRRPWLAVRVAVTVLIAEMVSGLLKVWIDRDRPPLANPDPGPLVALPATGSFPSGHATVAFACATALALAVPRLVLPLFALAALIGWSRVYVGVHYPLDVLAGALIGVALGFAVAGSGRLVRRLAVPDTPGATAPQTPRADPRRSKRGQPRG